MTKYTVAAPAGLVLPAEMPIKLTERQLGTRAHLVRPVKGRKGVYVADVPLSFKVGEVVEVDGELPKRLAALTDAPMEPSPPTRAAIQDGGDSLILATEPSV